MISFLVAVTSKVAIDSILAGATLGMNMYRVVRSVRSNSKENGRRRKR